MQRKQIKVGETYAVVKRMGRDAREDNSVAARVIEMGVEYTARRWGSFTSHNVKMFDGIRVEFVEPVVPSHSTFETLRAIEERGTLKASALKEKREEAITTTVLPGSKHVLRPWAEVVEMRERWDRERRERAEKMDAIGDVVEPVYEAVYYALAVKSETGDPHKECSIKVFTQPGTEKKRTTDATFTFDLDQLAALLGVAVKPEGGE
jgi:hypothetical protein